MMRVTSQLCVLGVCALLVQGCGTIRVIDPGVGAETFDVSAAQVPGHLNVKVVSDASGDEAEVVASDLITLVENDLVERKFKMTGGTADITVRLITKVDEYAAFGEYKVFEGDVRASAIREYDGNPLGKQKFSERGDRKLGEKDALESLAEKLGKKVSPWIAKQTVADQLGIAAAEITVSWTAFSELFGRKRGDYARTFVKTVNKKNVPGVLFSELVSENNPARQQTFRVVYIPERFPEGLMNRLAAIKELRIER